MIPRVHYRERQVLRKEDLQAEQQYRMQMHQAHHANLHGWGIVSGLALVTRSNQLIVKAGVAVDGYGRFLMLTEDLTINNSLIAQQLDGGTYDVCLLHWHASDEHNRWQEEVRLRLTSTSERTSSSIANSQPATQVLPAPTAEDEWPILVGRITLDGSEATPTITLEQVERPFIQLRAGQLTSVAGNSSLQIGNNAPNDPVQFAINVHDTPRLTIERDGKTAIYDPAQLEDAVRLGLHGQFYFDTPVQPPEAAAPWHVYRTAVTNDKSRADQLRFELNHPGDKGDPAKNQFVVGYWESDQFIKCFQVSADKTVTVFGNVTMQPGKEINEGPIEMNVADERFASAMLGNMVSGMSSAAPQVDAIYNAPLKMTLSITDPPALSAKQEENERRFTYTVELSNAADSEIYNIHFLELQIIEGRSQRERRPTSQIESLVKTSMPVSETSEIAPDVQVNQKVSLVVTAIGTLISGEQVQATATKNFVVQAKVDK